MPDQGKLGCPWVKVRLLFGTFCFPQVPCQVFVSCRWQVVRVWVEGVCCPTSQTQWNTATTCNGMTWHVFVDAEDGRAVEVVFHICVFGQWAASLVLGLCSTYMFSFRRHVFFHVLLHVLVWCFRHVQKR